MYEQIGRFGVFRRGTLLTPDLAARLEALGYGAIWIGGSPSGDLTIVEDLLDATSTITIAP